MTEDRSRLLKTLQAKAFQFAPSAPVTPAWELGEEALLAGPGGLLDSMGLLSFLLEAEREVAMLTGRNIVLLDERVLAIEPSPFRTLGALINYILDSPQFTSA